LRRPEPRYELYLTIEDIDYSRTKTKSPQKNEIASASIAQYWRRHRIAFRKKIYHTIDELQADLDIWLVDYNYRRPKSGPAGAFGQTPMQTFLDALPLAKEKPMAA
jgi:hypothetical protein